MIIVSTFICFLNSKCWKKRWTHVSFCCYCCAICASVVLISYWFLYVYSCFAHFPSSLWVFLLSVWVRSWPHFSLTSCFIWCNSLSLATFLLPSFVLFHTLSVWFISALRLNLSLHVCTQSVSMPSVVVSPPVVLLVWFYEAIIVQFPVVFIWDSNWGLLASGFPFTSYWSLFVTSFFKIRGHHFKNY